jgi:uncharacterized protein YceH (UPF0502 family)
LGDEDEEEDEVGPIVCKQKIPGRYRHHSCHNPFSPSHQSCSMPFCASASNNHNQVAALRAENAALRAEVAALRARIELSAGRGAGGGAAGAAK